VGALGWELIAIVAVANLGLQMMAGMNALKWSDDS
jgi:type IV secretory pathway VirB2 component (pilin)